MTDSARRPSEPGRDSLSRKELVDKMQEHIESLGLSNKTVSEVVEAFFTVYKQTVLENKRVEIRNFGIMTTELVRGRIIKHPETREQTIAPPYYRLAFKPSSAFKKLLKQKAKNEVTKEI